MRGGRVRVATALGFLVACLWLQSVAVTATPGEPNPGAGTRNHPPARPAPPLSTKGRAARTLHGDFDGDGFADSAIGASLKDVKGRADAGAVSVIYGSASGLAAQGSQLLTKQEPGVVGGGAQAGAEFGRYMGGGDFNGDGYFDLAVGIPEEDLTVNGQLLSDAGGIQIFYGSPHGLTITGNQFFNQATPGMAGPGAQAGVWFGSRLQGSDFDGDGYDDVAVSAMFQDVLGPDGNLIDSAGAVNVLYGGPSGLSAQAGQFWSEQTPAVPGEPGAGYLMGRALGSGDFNGDGTADLAIGIPHAEIRGVFECGVVDVLYGSPAGLTADGAQAWTQDTPGILGQCDGGDWLGRTGITGGDFNSDGYDDMAAGALQDPVDGVPLAGSVNVIYGSPAGLHAPGNQLFTENTTGSIAEGGAEYGDRFGRSTIAADFNCDGYADVAVGISNKRIGRILEAGALVVLYGTPTGLSEVGNQFWDADDLVVPGGIQLRAGFAGRVPDVGDLNGDGCADVSIGVFKEDLTSGSNELVDAGGMSAIYGSIGGLTAEGNQFWTLDSPGIVGNAKERDGYGQSDVG